MIENEIDIYSLKTICKLTKATCENFSEAAAVCLEYNKHKQGVSFSINGDLEGIFQLSWCEVTEQMFASKDDYIYTAEHGAYCLAMLIIQHKTEYNVVRQARRRTGFDYYLAKKEAELPFQSNDARLEVSGILKGTNGQINQRLNEKIEQTKQSDSHKTPAFAIVVEFNNPTSKVAKR